MGTGYFKLWRDLFEKAIWLNSTSNQRSILLALLYLANWQENKWEWCGEEYHCVPGEFITSHERIKNCAGKGITLNHVRSAIKRFENLGFITIKSPKNKRGGIKVIINNWDFYQNDKTQINHEIITNKTISNHEQITTIEEYKNKEYKNNKKNIIDISETKKFKKPSLEDVENYISEIGSNVNANEFIDFYSANGWKVGKNPMKDWKATLRGWDRRNSKKQNSNTEPQGGEYVYNPNI